LLRSADQCIEAPEGYSQAFTSRDNRWREGISLNGRWPSGAAGHGEEGIGSRYLSLGPASCADGCGRILFRFDRSCC